MSDMESKMHERYSALPYLELEAEIERLKAENSRLRAALQYICYPQDVDRKYDLMVAAREALQETDQ